MDVDWTEERYEWCGVMFSYSKEIGEYTVEIRCYTLLCTLEIKHESRRNLYVYCSFEKSGYRFGKFLKKLISEFIVAHSLEDLLYQFLEHEDYLAENPYMRIRVNIDEVLGALIMGGNN